MGPQTFSADIVGTQRKNPNISVISDFLSTSTQLNSYAIDFHDLHGSWAFFASGSIVTEVVIS